MTKIEQKITGYSVVKADEPATVVVPDVQQMHESVVRPEVLPGTTYKIKTPLSDHALYITINDILLNGGTQHETLRPFEIFINSKAMEHFQWIVALTRIISAVFRKGGDCTFLVEELGIIQDPRGGYFKKGRWMPSLVAEIGEIIEQHLIGIGIIKKEGLDKHQQKFVDEKKAQYEARKQNPEKQDEGSFPPEAIMCDKCQTKAVVLLDNCPVCLNCCASKCG